MTQTSERLELPSDTYHLLEQMAQARSIPLPELVAKMVRPFQAQEDLDALREEYRRLTDKALMRTMTRREEKRRDALCAKIDAASRQSNAGRMLEQSNRRADEIIEKSEALLALIEQQTAR